MLFYLDPPYWGNEADYGRGIFGRGEFSQMADVLRSLRGRFILSLNAHRDVYKTFEGFEIEEVDCTYSVSGQGNSKAVKEVIIRN